MIIGSSDSNEENGDKDGAESVTEVAENHPNDPVLSLANGFKRSIEAVDYVHQKYDKFPGRFKVVFGVLTFFVSVYFGRDIREFINQFVSSILTPVLGDFINFAFGIKIVLLLLVLLTIQVSIVNYRLNAIENKVGREQMPSDKDAATDGGRQLQPDDTNSDENLDSSGAGVLGGAATGAAIGASFGPGGVVGGAILGAIVGDEIEKSSTRNRKKAEIKTRIVENLLQNNILPPQAVQSQRVLQWFPAQNQEIAEKALKELVTESSSPVDQIRHNQIRLTSSSEAVDYIRENNGDIPIGFGGEGTQF